MSISWSVTKNTSTGIVRFEVAGIAPIDLSLVVIGDYVNIYGSGFNALNRGSFQITNVEIFYVVSTLHQAFEVKNDLGVIETASQASADDLIFFRPKINNIHSGNSRTVAVSSTEDGISDISIPATTEILNRSVYTAAYLNTNNSASISKMSRSKTGEVTVHYNGTISPSLSTSNSVYIDNVGPTPFEPFKSLGNGASYPSTATTDASVLDSVSPLQEKAALDIGRKNSAIVKAINGDGVIVCGHSLAASIAGDSMVVSRFRPVSSSIVVDNTLADGSTRYTYQWMSPGTSIQAAELLTASNITSGSYVGRILSVGGALVSLGNWSSKQTPASSVFNYDPSTNTSTAFTEPVGINRVGHTQNTLSDGSSRIVVYGGMEPDGVLTGTATNVNSTGAFIYDPASDSWVGGAPVFDTLQKRAGHCSTEMSSGDLLITGGFFGSQGHQADSSTVALWRNGSDVTGTYPLSATGTVTSVPAMYKKDWEYVSSSYASGIGDAAAVTALLGEWTAEWWSCGMTGTYPGSMSASGLGSGNIIAYGGVTESSPDNTLIHIRISGSNLIWRWENGAGTDVTGTIAISSATNGRFNHYALRKKFNGVKYDVELFVNGQLSGSSLNVDNASGGSSSSNWFIAKDPDGVTPNGFSGVINDIRISKVARTESEILLDYWRGGASYPTTAGYFKAGELHNSCEIWNHISNAVTFAGSMSLCRSMHTATLLPNGKIIVVGGLSHDPSSFVKDLISSTTNDFGCSKSTNTTEIYDPSTNRWEIGPALGTSRHNHSAIYIPDREALFIIGGQSTLGDDCRVIEIIDVNTMKVKRMAGSLPYNSDRAILLDNGTILCTNTDSNGSTYINTQQLICLEAESFGNKGLSGYHTVTEVGSGYFKFNTPETMVFSNFGKPNNNNPTSYTVVSAERYSNVTTLNTSSSMEFLVGEYVYVNFNNVASFGSGLKLITSTTSTSISYSETASNQGLTTVDGQIFKNYSDEAAATSWSSDSEVIPGPYLLDPVEGLSITNVRSSTTASISEGEKLTILPVADATIFPESGGFIVVGFGTGKQTTPIKYYGLYNQTALLIDYNHEFKSNINSGADVTWLAQRAPFAPESSIGGFYLTNSATGRVAAQATIRDISGLGIDVRFTVKYPGDNGLGGQGLPTASSTKLSDIVSVFAGDDIDSEIKALKG